MKSHARSSGCLRALRLALALTLSLSLPLTFACRAAGFTTGVAASGNGLGPSRRSVCAPLVLEVGIRLRVKCLVVLIVSCQKPEVYNDDTEVFAV